MAGFYFGTSLKGTSDLFMNSYLALKINQRFLSYYPDVVIARLLPSKR